MNLKEFNLKREIVNECYSNVLEIAKELKNENLITTIEQSIGNLKQDNFNMVIVGEFSRGKSTFINALLGKRILPASTKPTTTIINKISFGKESEFNLHFRDNNDIKRITEEEFKDITAKVEPDDEDESEVNEYNENLKLISSISYADIKYPTEICKEGIEIIDTPGTNDLDQQREEITFNFIPQSDIAIFLLSANQILSQSEVNFLKERIVDNDIKKVFFIINFKDRLETKEDEDKVILYAKEHLKERIDNPKIFMVSSKQALNFKRKENGEIVKGFVPETLNETGFDKMEKELTAYLVNERGQIKLKKYIDRGTRLADDLIINMINVRLKTVNLSANELEKRLKEALPYFESTKRECYAIINELKVALINLENEFVSQYTSGLELIARQANLAVNNYEGDLEIELIAREIESVVAPLQKDLQVELEMCKSKYIDIEIQKSLKKLRKIWDDMNFNFTKALVVTKENNNQSMIAINNVQDDGLSDTDLISGLITGGLVVAAFHLPFIVIPAAIFGGKYFSNLFESRKRQDFLVKIKMQVDRRYGEIIPSQVDEFRKEYRKSIDCIISPLVNQVHSKIQGLEKQMQSLIEEKKKEDLNVEKEIAKLDKCKKELELVKHKLEEVL